MEDVRQPSHRQLRRQLAPAPATAPPATAPGAHRDSIVSVATFRLRCRPLRLGATCALAGGFYCGPEGPIIHIGACVGKV